LNIINLVECLQGSPESGTKPDIYKAEVTAGNLHSLFNSVWVGRWTGLLRLNYSRELYSCAFKLVSDLKDLHARISAHIRRIISLNIAISSNTLRHCTMDQAVSEDAHNDQLNADLFIESGSSSASTSLQENGIGLTEMTQASSMSSVPTSESLESAESMETDFKATSINGSRIRAWEEADDQEANFSRGNEPHKDKSAQVNINLGIDGIFGSDRPSSNSLNGRRQRVSGNIYDTHDPVNKSTMEERTKNAPKQLSQVFQYTMLMEERMTLLEREVRELKISKDTKEVEQVNLSDGEASEDIETPPTLIPEIRRVQWAEFCLPRQTHSIDVLYGDPEDGDVQHMNPGHIAPLSKLATTRSSVKVSRNPGTESSREGSVV
jgi:hypothetical protein